jgi:D-alanyl-D-alanine carboxypeptidase (penicillin-binding protein 5/6)
MSFVKRLKLKYFLFVIPFLALYIAFKAESPDFRSVRGYQVGGESQQDWVEKKYEDTLRVHFEAESDWSPSGNYGTFMQPEIVGESAMLVELDSGKILFSKNPREKREIASLVKIMTAVVALEHKDLDDMLTVSESADAIGENTMGLSAGEAYSLEELLYGLILASGNDAAYTIAEGVAGDVDTFVIWMNMKAKELGLNDSYFADPSGLDDSSYSTTYDLVKLTRYALKSRDFTDIADTLEIELISDSHKYIYLYNQTNLLSSYPGVAGVKTGFTEEAGLCLVTYAINGGKEVVGVVLDSNDRKGDMILMLDYGYSNLGVVVEHNLF